MWGLRGQRAARSAPPFQDLLRRMNFQSETLAPKPSCKALPNSLNPSTRKSRNQVAQKHLFFDGPR